MPKNIEEAIRSNDWDQVRNFLSGPSGLPINIRNKAFETPLMIACAHKSVETVEVILENRKEKPNLEATDAKGWRAIHHAAKSGGITIFEKLREKGAKIDVTTKKGETLLHLAAQNGQEKVCNLLLQADEAKQTPLHLAAESCQLLIRHKAKIDARNKDQRTPLHLACKEGHYEVCCILLENEAEIEAIDKNKWTPMHWAARKGSVNVCQLLIANNANYDAKDKFQSAPLHIASYNGHIDLVTFYLI